jgi:hypothetical protein
MTNPGYQGVEDRLAAVNAVRSETAMRLTEARDRTEGKCARAAFMHSAYRSSLSLLDNMVGDLPVFNPDDRIELSREQQDILKNELDARVQKTLAIIALMINQGETDINEMESLISLIRSMDEVFFDFADDPKKAADEERRRGEGMRRMVYQYCRAFMFSDHTGLIEELDGRTA